MIKTLPPLFLYLNLMVLVGCSTYQSGGSFRSPQRQYLGQNHYQPQGKIKPPSEYHPQNSLSFLWPVKSSRLSQKFKLHSRKEHHGIDLAGSLGSPIYSSHEGVVVYSGSDFNSYGRMVILAYDGQWSTLYAHLQKSYVKTGDVLQQGDILGSMGRTGRATGVHLHFELLKEKIPVDPLQFLSKKKETPLRAI